METSSRLIVWPMSRKLRMVLKGLVGTAVVAVVWLPEAMFNAAKDDVGETVHRKKESKRPVSSD